MREIEGISDVDWANPPPPRSGGNS
jgi:hypothetical protein